MVAWSLVELFVILWSLHGHLVVIFFLVDILFFVWSCGSRMVVVFFNGC